MRVTDTPKQSQLRFREPCARDGVAINRLISESPPLDENSVYCNLLQCTHFASTSCVVESATGLVGFVSAYILPDKSDTLFIWQIVLDSSLRGRGLAKQMLREILARQACIDICFLQTSITKDNPASRATFAGFAKELKADSSESILFSSEEHFDREHDTEFLVSIGPFKNNFPNQNHKEQHSGVHPYVRQQFNEVYS